MPWSKRKPLVWDSTCSDTLCKSYVASASRKAGAAATKAETRKRDLYAALPIQYRFVPFAVETLGNFGDDALNLVQDLVPSPIRIQ
jgi:hypothetical protein